MQITTPIFNINDIVLILAIGLSLVLVLIQPALATRNKYSSRLLACFFLCIALADLGVMFLWNEYLPQTPVSLALVPYFYSAALLLKAPLLIFYVKSITEETFSLKPRDAVHLMPMVFAWLLIAFFGIDAKEMKLETFGMNPLLYKVIDFLWFYLKVIPLIYFISATYIVKQYHNKLGQQHSNVNETALLWLYFVSLVFVFSGLWSLILYVLAYFYRLRLGVTDNYMNFILLMALFYYSIYYAEHLTTTKADANEQEEANNAVDTKPLEATISKIMDGIKVQKLYLNQSINVEQFSHKIGVPNRDVSFAINKAFGTNFFEFINSYRIEEAKRYLSDVQYKDMTIMDILLASGFNSKSAFQRFFKRLAGTSPTEFRRDALKAAGLEDNND